jgi:hypothetical protein
VVGFSSLAAAVGTGAVYPLQPAIAEVGGALGTSLASVGVALARGPIGYLRGLALLVPLVDQCSPSSRAHPARFNSAYMIVYLIQGDVQG